MLCVNVCLGEMYNAGSVVVGESHTCASTKSLWRKSRVSNPFLGQANHMFTHTKIESTNPVLLLDIA